MNVDREERAKRQVVTSDWLKLEDGLGCTYSRFQFLPTGSILHAWPLQESNEDVMAAPVFVQHWEEYACYNV